METRSALKAIKTLSLLSFSCAVAGLFIFGNYLMVGGHRPLHKMAASGFTIFFFGKGAPIYVSEVDAISIGGLLGLTIASILSANWAHKKIG